MQSDEKSCFVVYPFGKLLPVINKISQFLSMKRHNWSVNWIQACNHADYKSIKALSILLNQWRENEIFYRVPKSSLKFHTMDHYANHICHVLCLLTKSKNSSNQNVESIMVEVVFCIIKILSFYYTKFENIEVFIRFGEIVDEIISIAENFILNYSMIKNKENINELLNYPQIHLVAVCLANLIDLLRDYDEKGPKVPKKENPSPQSLQQATIVIKHIIDAKCMAQFLSTFSYIKIDFIIFFDLHYEKQYNQYKQKTQPIRDKKMAQNRKRKEQMLEKYPGIIQNNDINQFNKVLYEGTITTPLQAIRKYFRAVTKAAITPKLFFAYINPLFRYLPRFVINSLSQRQQTFVFKKFLVPMMQELSKILQDKKENTFLNSNQLCYFKQIDIIQALSDTSFLDDLQATLIADFEYKIQQNKQVEEYQDQYVDLQNYFVTVSNFKNKVIKALQNIKSNFHQQLLLNLPSDSFRRQQTKKQSENKNLQSDIDQQSNKSITLNNKKQYNIKINHGSRNPDHKKSGPKPKQKKNSHHKEAILNIPQAIHEDEYQDATDTGEENRPFRSRKIEQKIERKQRKSKRNFDQDESNNAEEESLSLNLKPLQKKHQSVSPLPKSSNKSLQISKKVPEPTRVIQQRASKSQQRKSEGKNEPNCFAIIHPRMFLTYYQHQSNTYNARKIFREDRIEYRTPDINSPYWFYGNYVYRYPKFINSDFFQYPIVQTFKTDFKKLKLIKNVYYPKAQNHKYFMKLVFEQNQRVMKQIQKFQENCNKKKKPSTQLNEDRDKLIKMMKQLNKKKNKNLQFYLDYLREQQRITQVSVRLYPLIKTVYGQFSIRELTKLTQKFLQHLVKKQSYIQQFQTNIFNKKLRTLHDMVNQNVDNLTFNSIHELFIPMLFEIMHFVNSSDRSLDFFYKHYYKSIPSYMQSMVLFYMFQIESKNPVKQQLSFKSFFIDHIQAKDFADLLNFMIKDSKLNSMELKYMYEKIYRLLSQKCIMMIKMVEEILCNELIPMVKSEGERQERQRFRKQSHKLLQSLKQKFYQSFGTMIDLINVWLCLSYSSMKNDPNLPAKQLIPVKCMPLVYFCNRCGGPQTVQMSTKKLSNYQSCMCQYCSNSIMDRFQLASYNLYSLKFDWTSDIKIIVRDSTQSILKCLERYEWNVQILPVFEYKEDQESRYNRIMEVYEDEEPRNRSSENKGKQKGVKKSEEEYIQQDNEQYCYNNCQLLICYYEDLTGLINQALAY